LRVALVDDVETGRSFEIAVDDLDAGNTLFQRDGVKNIRDVLAEKLTVSISLAGAEVLGLRILLSTSLFSGLRSSTASGYPLAVR
jgi:hypothetical protein